MEGNESVAQEVDGRLKAESATMDGARAGAEKLKKRLPMIGHAASTSRMRVEISASSRRKTDDRIEHQTMFALLVSRFPGLDMVSSAINRSVKTNSSLKTKTCIQMRSGSARWSPDGPNVALGITD